MKVVLPGIVLWSFVATLIAASAPPADFWVHCAEALDIDDERIVLPRFRRAQKLALDQVGAARGVFLYWEDRAGKGFLLRPEEWHSQVLEAKKVPLQSSDPGDRIDLSGAIDPVLAFGPISRMQFTDLSEESFAGLVFLEGHGGQARHMIVGIPEGISGTASGETIWPLTTYLGTGLLDLSFGPFELQLTILDQDPLSIVRNRTSLDEEMRTVIPHDLIPDVNLQESPPTRVFRTGENEVILAGKDWAAGVFIGTNPPQALWRRKWDMELYESGIAPSYDLRSGILYVGAGQEITAYSGKSGRQIGRVYRTEVSREGITQVLATKSGVVWGEDWGRRVGYFFRKAFEN